MCQMVEIFIEMCT
uniref:Uncharacterized protein n=1 Tax=Arundo donax TaxID=35708 RepID=A0A0A9B6S5_ARUDO